MHPIHKDRFRKQLEGRVQTEHIQAYFLFVGDSGVSKDSPDGEHLAVVIFETKKHFLSHDPRAANAVDRVRVGHQGSLKAEKALENDLVQSGSGTAWRQLAPWGGAKLIPQGC